MGTILLVLFVLFMALWALGGYWFADPAVPGLARQSWLLAWLCMLILGLIVFGAVDVRPVQPVQVVR